MAISLLVKQIEFEAHPLAHRRIKSLRGQSGQMEWQYTQNQAIDFIQTRAFHYHFLKDGRALRIVLGRRADGELFLKSEADGDAPETLLALPHSQDNQPRIAPSP